MGGYDNVVFGELLYKDIDDNEYLNDILTDGNDWILENILLSENKIEEINNFISSYKSTMSSENPFLGKEF